MELVFIALQLTILGHVYCDQTYSFKETVNNFVIGGYKLYVLTGSRLYQMSLDFKEEHRKEILNSTRNKVSTLLPFVGNSTFLLCGSLSLRYCEVLNLNDISTSIYNESIDFGANSYIAFFTDHGKEKYLLVSKNSPKTGAQAVNDAPLVTLRSTSDAQTGGIFSFVEHQTVGITPSSDKRVQSVDGFQLKAPDTNLTYLFLNIIEPEFKVSLLLLRNQENRQKTFETMKGAVLACCGSSGSWMLQASALIPGGNPILWAGVFKSTDNADPSVVAIFDISPSRTGDVSDFCRNTICAGDKVKEEVLRPSAVVFRHHFITAIAALRINGWIVLFCSTNTSLLFKLVLDNSLKPGCPEVLYSSDVDERMLSKMFFYPENHSDIYIALGEQMRKVPVSKCEVYQTFVDCWSAVDPFCGWCVSDKRCTFHHNCAASNWVSVPGTSLNREIISVHMKRDSTEQDITVEVIPNLNGYINFSCAVDECDRPGPAPCSCILTSDNFPPQGLNMRVNVTIAQQMISKEVYLTNCSSITGNATSNLCNKCLTGGCEWSHNKCLWRTALPKDSSSSLDVCKSLPSEQADLRPDILSITPNKVSLHGQNNAFIKGTNLESVTAVRFQGRLDCSPKISPVFSRNSSVIGFHIPQGTKGLAKVCVLTSDGQCYGNTSLTYDSQAVCSGLEPNISWASGGREVYLVGSKLEVVEGVIHDSPEDLIPVALKQEGICKYQCKKLIYSTPSALLKSAQRREVVVGVVMGNFSVACAENLTYLPDPHFLSFTAIRTGNDLSVTIQKTADSLQLNKSDIKIEAIRGKLSYKCEIEQIEHSTDASSIQCDIQNQPGVNIDYLKITVGKFVTNLQSTKPLTIFFIIPAVICVTLAICVVLVVVYMNRKKQRNLMEEMNQRLEMLESDIRNDIRQGFVDMQTERSELICSTGAIPFLDYKHFASRIFFPEGGPLATAMMRDFTQVSVKERQDQSCRALAHLIRDQLFLTSLVHALEEQKSFQLKDKVMVASLMTLALHDDLPYLTQVMEELLISLMEQPSNAQPKLLLRRTESIVEKLLTNWMSICLYGFLRECVGQPLYLLVCALMEQISLGPVDSVTGKALYTLSEDWLLWQAQDFSPLKLNVLFAVGTEGEVSEPLEITALDCDTVEQVKEKILLTFHRKFGFRYTQQLRHIDIEVEKAGCYEALQEIDTTSEMTGDITMLNTLKHYQIPDGATIKVITKKLQEPTSPSLSFKEEPDFQVKYFHLIDPDLADSRNSERKKLKVKEVYLTKLLSTKVAVHSYVETLFRAIWGGSKNNKLLTAVKYFFDFLDLQADKKKISDPDVLHIWKTNSLPLRFWVNILKNPQFVFDLEKTPHLDGCLSVVAQAFMDSFSLSEQQLGKHAPTNKLLYAKDVPQFKQEVKAFYKRMKDQQPIKSPEFIEFLQEESKKHENEFNESVALCELYRFIHRYFNQIEQKLEHNSAPPELREELHQVKELFEKRKKTTWE